MHIIDARCFSGSEIELTVNLAPYCRHFVVEFARRLPASAAEVPCLTSDIFVFISASFRFIFFEVRLIFAGFDLLSRVLIIIRGSCCLRTIQCTDFGLWFWCLFCAFKFLPEHFILFFCVSL